MIGVVALLGALAGLGLFIAIGGALGVRDSAPQPRAVKRTQAHADQWPLRALLAIAFAVATWLVTQWPVAAIGAGVAGVAIPSLRRSGRARVRALERTEAVASWTEMLRDTMAAAAGLNEAIVVSARVAPSAIRTEVQALAVRSEHQPLGEALRRFAADVDDPVADTVVVALVLSSERQGGNLGAVLSQIAKNARDMASMRLRVEASRARTYASVRFIVVVTLVFSVGLVVFAPAYLEPFDRPEGQLMLAVILGLFGSAGWALHRLGQPAEAARLFVREAET